jgi:phage repressor protein C with HTH and peptisase S24 domain
MSSLIDVRELAHLSSANSPVALVTPMRDFAHMDAFRASIRDYIKDAVAAAGARTPTELAKKLKMAPSTLNRFMADPEHASLPRTDTLHKLHEAVGEKLVFPIASIRPPVPMTKDLKRGDDIVFEGNAYVAIGVFDVRVSAGPGALNEDVEEPETYNLFRQEWLHRITNTSANHLAVLRVSGDSMARTLHNGDHVLVDRTVRRVERQGIYIIQDVDTSELQVKRCSRDPRTGLIDIKSDNPEYPSYDGVREDRFTVQGRVVWLGRNVGG